jgi:hypothetical protein
MNLTRSTEADHFNGVLEMHASVRVLETKRRLFACVALHALLQAGIEPSMENIGVATELPSLGSHNESARHLVDGLGDGDGDDGDDGYQPPMSLADMATELWGRLADKVNEGGTVGGRACAAILGMADGVEQTMLGKIWATVDSSSKGRVDFTQFGKILGAISQVQRGLALDIVAIRASTPAPKMIGL